MTPFKWFVYSVLTASLPLAGYAFFGWRGAWLAMVCWLVGALTEQVAAK